MNKFPVLMMALVGLLLSDPAAAKIRSIHQDLVVRLDPGKGTLEVSARLEIEGQGSLAVRLAGNFVVTAFSVDGKKAAVNRTDGRWRIDFKGGPRHTVNLVYRGALTEPSVSAEGSFFPAGSAWHPSFEAQKFSYRLDIRVPEPQRVIAPGRLIIEEKAGGDYRAVFQSYAPLGGIVLMAGPYQIAERQFGKIKVRTWFHSEIAHLSDGYLETAGGYLDFYQQWIGEYPYSAFHIVSGLPPVGLGYPGLTFMGRRVLALPFIRTSSLGHEVLHNWWGNAVEVEYRSGNWSEGLTTFMADYTYARLRSENEARKMRIGWLRDYAALPPARDHPVVSFVSRSHDAEQIIGYNKVAFIFHMLRRNIGEAAFDKAIKQIWRTHAMATASWGDLQKAFEGASGQDLGPFFQQWLQRTGAPKLVLEQASAEGHKVSFVLRQDGAGYLLNVPVEVETSAGKERFQVKIEGGINRLEINAAAPVLKLTIDPDFDIFRVLGAAETPPILRDVTLNSRTRIMVPAGDGFRTLAARLAERLLDTGGKPLEAAGNPPPSGPLLIIGTSPDVAALLSKYHLPATPADIDGQGTARAWAARWGGTDGAAWPILVIEADGIQALQALLRPLPHYRAQGYVVFDGGKAILRGSRPPGHGPLSIGFK